MARKIFDYTFADSGITVKVRKVSPFVAIKAREAMEADKSNPKPTPPGQLVEEPGPLQGTYEENPADPDYIAALRKWEAGINNKVMEIQIRQSIVEICDPDWQDELAQYRLDMEDVGITDLPENDVYLYILHLAAASNQDIGDFANFLINRTIPNQGVVQAALEQFPDNVSE